MKMKIIILILFCLIGFLIGRFVVLNNANSSLDSRTGIECQGGICPMPEGWEDD